MEGIMQELSQKTIEKFNARLDKVEDSMWRIKRVIDEFNCANRQRPHRVIDPASVHPGLEPSSEEGR
jgi:hypothetical protein